MTEPKIPERRNTDRELAGKVLSIEDRLDKGDKRMGGLEASLAENTAATKEVLEIVTMAKGFFKVLGHIGNAIKWIAGFGAAAGALWTTWPHGTPPK